MNSVRFDWLLQHFIGQFLQQMRLIISSPIIITSKMSASLLLKTVLLALFFTGSESEKDIQSQHIQHSHQTERQQIEEMLDPLTLTGSGQKLAGLMFDCMKECSDSQSSSRCQCSGSKCHFCTPEICLACEQGSCGACYQGNYIHCEREKPMDSCTQINDSNRCSGNRILSPSLRAQHSVSSLSNVADIFGIIGGCVAVVFLIVFVVHCIKKKRAAGHRANSQAVRLNDQMEQ